ncbi:hypothetical protein AX14_003217 [Amanita brunnescens Koide BX004]|nr:hypothetical protein AX14_003217 [Amanita brunnescens Koide BX004]
MTLSGSVVNKATVDLIGELLNLLENDNTSSELGTTADVEPLLDFLLNLLRNNGFANSGIGGANHKARKLLFKVITMTKVIPRSLFITDVRIISWYPMPMGGLGSVFKGEYEGQVVAIKVLDRPHQESSFQTFRIEALAWRSISHRYILPLLGIHEELFLVSPFMKNGTLSQWRREKGPDIIEIHRVMLEVAEAIQYLHSGGMIHGDLHGLNILLDSEFHCQITGFNSTLHSEVKVAWTSECMRPSYAAPELLGICSECGRPECNECHEGHKGKTMKTDVYAFGCLYYAIFFDVVPFQLRSDSQIIRLIMSGKRPKRLDYPRMEDNAWNLIQSCWKPKGSERPTMDNIVKTLTF